MFLKVFTSFVAILICHNTYGAEGSFTPNVNSPEAVQKVLSSIVRIAPVGSAPNRGATGFYVAENLIVTNWHVIDDKCGLSPEGDRPEITKNNAIKCDDIYIQNLDGERSENLELVSYPGFSWSDVRSQNLLHKSYFWLQENVSHLKLDAVLIRTDLKGKPVEFDLDYSYEVGSRIFILGFPGSFKQPRDFSKKHLVQEKVDEKIDSALADIQSAKNKLKKPQENCSFEEQTCRRWYEDSIEASNIKLRTWSHFSSILAEAQPVDYDYSPPNGTLRYSRGSIAAPFGGAILDDFTAILNADTIPTKFYLADIDQYNGNSGGPVFNEDGLVIGIVSAAFFQVEENPLNIFPMIHLPARDFYDRLKISNFTH